jgi:hypothetical protein
LLKHADEQTVVGLAAVLHAAQHERLADEDFTLWGVVAAPCFLGRATLVSAMARFDEEGAWGLSPHFIPHRSQHAVSGTISQVLKIHGPNFGSGGGPGGVTEALLAGAVLLEGDRPPGVWVVVSTWEPELIPDAQGEPTGPTTCHAIALALVPSRSGWQGPRLRVAPRMDGAGRSLTADGGPSVAALAAVLTALAATERPPTPALWRWDASGLLEISRGAAPPIRAEQTGQPTPTALEAKR